VLGGVFEIFAVRMMPGAMMPECARYSHCCSDNFCHCSGSAPRVLRIKVPSGTSFLERTLVVVEVCVCFVIEHSSTSLEFNFLTQSWVHFIVHEVSVSSQRRTCIVIFIENFRISKEKIFPHPYEERKEAIHAYVFEGKPKKRKETNLLLKRSLWYALPIIRSIIARFMRVGVLRCWRGSWI